MDWFTDEELQFVTDQIDQYHRYDPGIRPQRDADLAVRIKRRIRRELAHRKGENEVRDESTLA